MLLSLVLVAGTGHADSSVSAPAAAPERCRWEDTAYARALADPNVKRLALAMGEEHFLQAGRNHYLFGDTWHRNGRMTAVDASGHRLLSVARGPAALVEDRAGVLAGLLILGDNPSFYPGATGWTPLASLAFRDSFSNAASVVLDGDSCTAYVGLYHRNATGSQLVSVDLCTGALRWRAEVEQMNVSHSKYYNDVTLQRRGDEIVMIGVEAAGCYEQAFDAATGRRLRVRFSRR